MDDVALDVLDGTAGHCSPVRVVCVQPHWDRSRYRRRRNHTRVARQKRDVRVVSCKDN